MAKLSKKRTDVKDKKPDRKNGLSKSKLKRKANGIEKGPTKKQMREEDMNKNKLKKKSLDSKSDKKNKSDENKSEIKKSDKKFDKGNKSDEKTADNKNKSDKKPVDNKKSIDKRKISNNKMINNKNKKAKVMYTEENINSFLLEAKKSKSKDKTINLLLFIFKQFKTRPSDILAKIKILTSDLKIEENDDKIHNLILKHVFKYFEMNGSISECLFSMLSTDSLLSKYISNFLFSITFDIEEYEFYFNSLITELCNKLEKVSKISMNDYIELIGNMDQSESIQKYTSQINDEMINNETNEEMNDEKDNDESVSSCDKLEEEKESETESSISLVSLNDDEEIRRIDIQLGKIFKKGTISAADETFCINLIKCLELLIKSNYAVNSENLIQILYFGQFDFISKSIKFIIKDLLNKINEPARIFKIYQMCSLAIPENYQFFNIFSFYCGDIFDLKNFMISVFHFGLEDFLVNKINKDKFYSIYESTLGQEFDDFLIALIQNEHRAEKLKELEDQYFKPDIKEEISKKIKK